MARKKKKKVVAYQVVVHSCRRCGFKEEILFDETVILSVSGKQCPKCHTHMPHPEIKHIIEE